MARWRIKVGGDGTMATLAKQHKCLVFCVFIDFRKVSKFAASIERPKAKSVSASGGLCPPDSLTKGFAPGPRWGLRAQTPL